MRSADLAGVHRRSYLDGPCAEGVYGLSWFKKEKHAASRHENPDDAIARYLEELRQADVQGVAQPASALNGLCDAYLDKGDLHSAVDHYRQSAEAYAREGMYDNAIACCKKIRRYAPENDGAALLLGRFYAAKGLRADAARELEAYAERMERAGQPKEAIAALADVVGLGLDKPLQREKLARLYAENGQRDAAVQEYRALRRDYEARGDQEAVARISDRLAEHGDRPPRPAAPAPVQAEEQEGEPAVEEAPARSGAKEPSAPPPIPLGLEIEHTSYSERSPAPDPEREAAEPVGRAEVRGGYAEMVSLAERAAAEGDSRAPRSSWPRPAGGSLRSAAGRRRSTPTAGSRGSVRRRTSTTPPGPKPRASSAWRPSSWKRFRRRRVGTSRAAAALRPAKPPRRCCSSIPRTRSPRRS